MAVVTGSFGAGHDSAARELAGRLREVGCEVDVFDIVEHIPLKLGPALRRAYYAQIRRAPSSWGSTLEALQPGRPMNWLATRVLESCAGRVAERLQGYDLIATTHPFGAQTLGHARSTGQIGCPVVTYLTDSSVHSLWVHPGVDLNLAIHRIAAADVRRWGAVASVVTPLVGDVRVLSRVSGRDPFADVGIVGSRALVTGGSLGIGDLEQSCLDILATSQMTPVALCGTDEKLRQRLQRIPGVVALGWREDLTALMAASDCIVQNAGGFTSLEGLASGTPVITYRPIPGHGTANAENLDRAGLVPWVRHLEDLGPALDAAKKAPRIDRLPIGETDVVSVLGGQLQHLVVR